MKVRTFNRPAVGRGRSARLVAGSALLVLGAIAYSNSAKAQAIEGFLEGPIQSIEISTNALDGLQGWATINGIVAAVPDGTPISTPTNTGLSLADLLLDESDPSATPLSGDLPGRPTGFLNGTCLCLTEFDAGTGAVTILDMVAEPAENVVIAAVSNATCSTDDCSDPADRLRVGGSSSSDGLRVVKNADPRIPSGAPTDGAGFEANLNSSVNPSLIGNTAAVEGYLGVLDGEPAIFYYALSIDGAARLSNEVQVSIERAQCRNRQAEYRVRGTVSEVVGGQVSVVAINEPGGPMVSIVGQVAPVLDPITGVGTWDLRVNAGGLCSDLIRAEYGGAKAEFGVEIRN